MNKIVKAIVSAFLCVCFISALCVSTFAAAVGGMFYHLDPQYINGSQVGYSEGNFVGNYYYDGSGTSNAIIYAETKGGDVNTYFSALTVSISGVGSHYLDSDGTGSSLLTFRLITESNPIGALGQTSHACAKKSNQTAENWYQAYQHTWVGAQAGWC